MNPKTFHEKQVEKAKKAIESFFAMPKDIRFYVNAANFDLYFGPRDSDEEDPFPWHGFIDATKRIRAWYEEQSVSTLFWDTQAEELVTRLPEAEEINGEIFEPWYEDFYEFDSMEIKKILFGKELMGYI